MNYLRSLALNFLIIFFINHVMPGISVGSFQNAPNIGADLLFSGILGLLNASIFPVFVLFNIPPKAFYMSALSFIFTLTAFIIAATSNIGVKALTLGGAAGAIIIIGFVSSISNYLEYKHAYHENK